MAAGYRPDNVAPDMPRSTTASDERSAGDVSADRVVAPGGLHVQLEAPLPSEAAVGAGSALFVLGWSFHRDARIRSLSLVVDGRAQPVLAHGMPRLDVLRSLHPGLDPFATAGMTADAGSTDDPLLHSYRSGFWGIARIAEPPDDGVCELLLQADLEGGGEAVAELARIPVVSVPEGVAIPEPDPAAGPLAAIGDAQLVYSDARIVGRGGERISETYWHDRRNNHSSLLSLMVANAVTGAASLFPRALLDDALPFPPAQFAHYHDHWIALTA